MIYCYIKEHTREHISSSNYAESFAYISSLVNHQKIYPGGKPYSYDHNGISFAQKDTLLLHQRTHTWEKPFSCDHCGKGFTSENTDWGVDIFM